MGVGVTATMLCLLTCRERLTLHINGHKHIPMPPQFNDDRQRHCKELSQEHFPGVTFGIMPAAGAGAGGIFQTTETTGDHGEGGERRSGEG